MKVKNITIGIRSLEEGLDEFSKVVRAVSQGRSPREKREGIYFETVEAMRAVLTPRRLELLHLIRQKRPQSVYGLARLSGRHLKNVQDDVSLLSRIGLLSLSRTTQARPRVVPRVGYNQLQVQIPV